MPVVPAVCLFVALTAAALQFRASAAEPGPVRPWTNYQAIMWIGESAHKQPRKLPLFFERLREMGINAGMVYGDADPKALVANGLPYYVENIVNKGLCLKFNSKVTDWDRFITQWARDGRPESAFLRDYCLDDPQWQEWARAQMRTVARRNAANQPVAYDIRDELSTTVSANPFDYDFNPLALRAFRTWLKSVYPGIEDLNTEWGTRFENWDAVTPFSTDQIKSRMAGAKGIPTGKIDWGEVAATRFSLAAANQAPLRWNFAPWADFRTYMDLSLARVLNDLRIAARDVDPATPVGIEGTQMPHTFGGYDLWRLSQSLDWVEPYDIGNAREIFGSFMPGKTIMTTVFEKDTPHASRRLWHLLLEGDKGCIIWWSEDCIDWNSPNYELTPKAKELKPVLNEMTSGVGQLFLRAKRITDPVYLHYSQPSIQVDWLVESTVDGATWIRRFSSHEAAHNRQAKIRNSWLKLFQDLGCTPQFISTSDLERGTLPRGSNVVVVLPCSWALSPPEAIALHETIATGGVVYFDGFPGVFNEHGRFTGKSPLEQFMGNASETNACVVVGPKKSSTRSADIAGYAVHRQRNTSLAQEWRDWASERLGNLQQDVRINPAHCVRTHRYSVPGGTLLAFERNIDWQMSEDLKQAGGNESLERPIDVEARLRISGHVYELRTGRYLGHTNSLAFTLDPWKPSLYAALDSKLPEDTNCADELLARMR